MTFVVVVYGFHISFYFHYCMASVMPFCLPAIVISFLFVTVLICISISLSLLQIYLLFCFVLSCVVICYFIWFLLICIREKERKDQKQANKRSKLYAFFVHAMKTTTMPLLLFTLTACPIVIVVHKLLFFSHNFLSSLFFFFFSFLK